MPKKRPRTLTTSSLVVAVSDLHCGSALGLCPRPGAILPDGGQYLPSKGQQWLWQNWLDFIEQAKKAVKGRRCYVVINGDAIDGQVKESAQVFLLTRKAQRDLAIECLEPLVKLADRLFIVRGTSAHTGRIAENEEGIAADLGGEKSPEGTHSWWHLQADFGGALLDFAHHINGSSRAWTAGGPAIRLAADIVIEHAGKGRRIPDLALRSHVHKYHDSFENVAGCRGIILPAWQLRTEYGHRIAAKLADIGGLLCKIDGGRPSPEIVRYKPEKTNPWREK